MFITIDGPDGVGKTTVANLLVQKIQNAALQAVYTAEPSKLETGVEIRRILREGTPEEAEKLADLFVEDRRLHLAKEIEPWLQQGIYVVCDRYKYSTISYQQLQGGADVEKLIEMNADFLKPDIAFILNVADADILLNRIDGRQQQKEIFETKATLEVVVKIYKEMKTRYFPQENIVEILLGAEETPDQIAEKMWQVVKKAKQ
ncbi:MAG: dTMP kinase [Oscillospiraceae bacterium]